MSSLTTSSIYFKNTNIAKTLKCEKRNILKQPEIWPARKRGKRPGNRGKYYQQTRRKPKCHCFILSISVALRFDFTEPIVIIETASIITKCSIQKT